MVFHGFPWFSIVFHGFSLHIRVMGFCLRGFATSWGNGPFATLRCEADRIQPVASRFSATQPAMGRRSYSLDGHGQNAMMAMAKKSQNLVI
jgi:hypothetical protein